MDSTTVENNNNKMVKPAKIEKPVQNVIEIKRNSVISINGVENIVEKNLEDVKPETGRKVLEEIYLPIFLAGLGSVGAGLLLNHVKETRVFSDIPEFLIVVTPLLGLKGNVEMTLSSKMSTLSNLGVLENTRKIFLFFIASIGLTQAQSTILGFLASILATILSRFNDNSQKFQPENLLLLITTCLLTTTITSFIIRIIMMSVVLLSKKYHINPDNVATPIASSLGDITTLLFLSLIGNYLYIYNSMWIGFLVVFFSFSLLFLWIWMARKELNCWKSLKCSFTPIISAMFISSFGGMVLDKSSEKFQDLALYQPLINAVGGNLVSVQASRLSTDIQKDNISLNSESFRGKVFESPIKVFFKDGLNSISAGILIILGYPVHLIFITVLHQIANGNWILSNWSFYLFYLSAYTFQILILIYLARILVNFLSKHKLDTDFWSIPFLTAFGDLLGTLGLFSAFYLMYLSKSFKI